MRRPRKLSEKTTEDHEEEEGMVEKIVRRPRAPSPKARMRPAWEDLNMAQADTDDTTAGAEEEQRLGCRTAMNRAQSVRGRLGHESSDSEGDIGPSPLPRRDETGSERHRFGDALLPGEGSAMAAYVQSGKRIPRRGEIGMNSQKIAEFESIGYVMSGNRNQKMNAVRLRKESQVITAEGKKSLLKQHLEEKLQKENKIVADFKEIINKKFKPQKSLN